MRLRRYGFGGGCVTVARCNGCKRLRRNAKRTAERAAKRAGLVCQQCGKPLAAQRPAARFCGPTCRSQAHRAGLSPS
jgi:hypothetical protein